MNAEEWRAKAVELFGRSGRNWRFKCPKCGGVQTPMDFVKRGETKEEAARLAPQQCIKRKAALSRGSRDLKKDECDWAAFGLFRGPVIVTDDDGHDVPVFEFAPLPKPCHHWDGDGREVPCLDPDKMHGAGDGFPGGDYA
jgi:hypothetical protein